MCTYLHSTFVTAFTKGKYNGGIRRVFLVSVQHVEHTGTAYVDKYFNIRKMNSNKTRKRKEEKVEEREEERKKTY